MSLPSNSALFMAQAERNGNNHDQARETFHKFFECWISEQNQHLEELVTASKDQPDNAETTHEHEERERRLIPLIDRVVQHYEQYYRAKSRWANRDVLSMLNPSWRSSLEDAFLWIGGWRPSMAFHLLYSKSGLQLEASFAEFLRGLTTRDLSNLSLEQLNRVDELHRRTITEEKEITEKLAKQQESVADSTMVKLSHAITELIRDGEANQERVGTEEHRVDSSIASKEEGLTQVLHRADDLRMKTLKEVLNILNPIQAVHFLIAAAELHLRVHDWGKKKDAMQSHVSREDHAGQSG